VPRVQFHDRCSNASLMEEGRKMKGSKKSEIQILLRGDSLQADIEQGGERWEVSGWPPFRERY